MAAITGKRFLLTLSFFALLLQASHGKIQDQNRIYGSFLTHPRQAKPSGQEFEAGECCMALDHVEVPVGSSAIFTSPNFPKSYPSDMNCGWKFTTSVGYTFDMHCHFSHLKRNDKITMIDERYQLTSFIENVREKETFYYFRSENATVVFTSDGAMSARGFECSIWPVESRCSSSLTTPLPSASPSSLTTPLSSASPAALVQYFQSDYKTTFTDSYCGEYFAAPSTLLEWRLLSRTFSYYNWVDETWLNAKYIEGLEVFTNETDDGQSPFSLDGGLWAVGQPNPAYKAIYVKQGELYTGDPESQFWCAALGDCMNPESGFCM